MLHPSQFGGAARAGPAALRTTKDVFGGSGENSPQTLESKERRLDGSLASQVAPESRASLAADQHGGGRSYNNGGAAMFSNRTDQRFSRYFRPIAPKPPAPKPGESAGSAASDPQSSSTLSYERTNAKPVTASSEVSRGKRTRRRIGVADSVPSPRRPKRGSAVGAPVGSAPAGRPVIRVDKPRTVSCKSTAVVGGIEKAVEQFAPDKPVFYQYHLPQPQHQFRPLVPASDSFMLSKEGPSGTHEVEMAPIEMRLGFQPPPPPLPGNPRFDRRKFGLGFGALSLGKHPRYCPKDIMLGCNEDALVDTGFREGEDGEPQMVAHPCFTISNGCSEVVSDAESRKTNLVTLSLLPDTPSQGYNSSEASVPTNPNKLPFLPLALGISSRSWEADEDLGTTEREQSRGGSSSTEPQLQQAMELRPLLTLGRSSGNLADDRNEPAWAAAVVDSRQLERDYANVPDPMILMDEADKCVLWTNQAFKRAENERSNGKAKEIGGPYLDPLGIRTQLCSYTYQPLQGPRIKAILWNFLKKFVMTDTNGTSLVECRDGEDKRQRTPDRVPYMMDLQEQQFPESMQINHRKPIVPRPVRPIGSTLTVTCMENCTSRSSSPIKGGLDSVKEQLELAAMPAVITDQQNRVMWVNAAYKQLVGQPECSWLASTMGKKNISKDNLQQPRLTGEVVLKCYQPLSQRFSCRVHLQWTNQGEDMSTTVSCDVTRIENDTLEHIYVWKLMSGP